MAGTRRESISDDWEELDSAASVISFDEESGTTSPAAPLEATTPAIVTPALQLPLRPRDETSQPTGVTSSSTAAASSSSVASSVPNAWAKVPLSKPPPYDETPPKFPHQETTSTIFIEKKKNQETTSTIFREKKEIPLRVKDENSAPAKDDDDKRAKGKEREPRSLLSYYIEESQRDDEEDEGKENSVEENENIAPVDDPREYHKSCTQTISLVSNVSQYAHALGGHRISTMSQIRQTCDHLSAQAKELETMLDTYAKHWTARQGMVQIPLSPEVSDMLAELTRLLHRTMVELKCVEPEEDVRLEAPDIPLAANQKLGECGVALEQMSDTFAEFLPMMKVDFNEFRTKHMGFPPATIDSSPNETRRPPPNPTISRIRNELYTLKDHLITMAHFLRRLKNSPEFPETIDDEIIDSTVSVVQAIAKILTNNPSEWIDSDTTCQESMTYAQFATLDAEILYDIASHIKLFLEELDDERWEDKGSYSLQVLRNHQAGLLIHAGMLDQIKETVGFTKTLLFVD
ncbi:hypothetical protein NW768_011292 [Fusarium equiseti]|uniref:Uncharacterized protein n=1 Tax=Fusarium equiseti TaxID=61235 RepID=A0ABQ8QXV1_FUSEQ|nr:hypothetical protein NW768_011292 [Fusarium equiseti]